MLPSLLTLAVTLPLPPALEISPDGHLVVRPDPAPARLIVARGEAPFGAAPDWQNDLRRQVGGLQVADMNHDGWPDLVAGCYQSNSFPAYEAWPTYVYFNVGGTIEAAPSWISTDEVSTGDVQVGDIDGDGHLDVFAANGGFAMSDSAIYFGRATGPATTPGWYSNEPGGAWNNHAAIVDLDRDGDLDVVTANQGNSEFDPYRPIYAFTNHDGVLETLPSWSSDESSIQGFLAAGDFDGDGWVDLAASKWANFESAIYQNVGGALGGAPIWTTGAEDTDKGVGWGDFDGDGVLDLALGHTPTRVYRNSGETFALEWEATGSYFGQQDLRVFDVDRDGDDDLAEIHFANGVVNLYLNQDGVLDSAPSWSYDSAGSGTAIAFGDIDGDDMPDLVVGNSGNVSLMVFLNQFDAPCTEDLDGDGSVGVGDLLAVLAAWGTAGGDVTGDGTTDVADLLAILAAWGSCA